MPVLYDLDKCRGKKGTIGFLMALAEYSNRPVRSVIGLLEMHRDYRQYRYKNN
jgi:hypothetical protein